MHDTLPIQAGRLCQPDPTLDVAFLRRIAVVIHDSLAPGPAKIRILAAGKNDARGSIHPGASCGETGADDDISLRQPAAAGISGPRLKEAATPQLFLQIEVATVLR